jgi:hypothetical protein
MSMQSNDEQPVEKTLFEQMMDALDDAELEIETMLEDLCDEREEDISAHRTLATIRAARTRAEDYLHTLPTANPEPQTHDLA